jgi:hypothetical protein
MACLPGNRENSGDTYFLYLFVSQRYEDFAYGRLFVLSVFMASFLFAGSNTCRTVVVKEARRIR